MKERFRGNQAPLAQTLRLFLFVLALCGLARMAAAEGLALRDGVGKYELGRHLSYLEDRSGRLRIEDVMGAAVAQRFTPSQSERLGFGFTDSAYWYRFALNNVDAAVGDWILEAQYPLLDLIDVYLVYPGKPAVSYRSGDTLPFSQRSLKHRSLTFALPLRAGEAVTVYLRVKTQSAMLMPLTLWSPQAFSAEDHEEQLGLGLYYGILAAMFCYNLMIYLSIRDRSYLYYLHYIGGWILFQMALNGLAFEYLWPAHPEWGNRATPFFLCFSGAGVMLFTRSFLQLREHLPRMDAFCRFYFWLALAVMAATFFVSYGTVMKSANALALLAVGVLVAAALLSLRRGVAQARFFLLAWTALLLGSSAYILRQFNVLPSMFITDYGMQIGSALEVILLSFALAHRMRMLKEENARIQKEAAEMLEARVQQRTHELDCALRELSVASEKLKDLSRTDALTGCRNRACFDELLELEWQRARDAGSAIGLLMLDIDHFKQINDTYGHPCGDACLKHVVQVIQGVVDRPGEAIFRYGGEEFAIMLPETDRPGALQLAQAMLAQIAALPFAYEGMRIPVTVSIGAASMVPEGACEAIILEADRALYEAKRRGRNQVCAF